MEPFETLAFTLKDNDFFQKNCNDKIRKYFLKPENSRLLCKIGDSSKYLTNENKLKGKTA